MKIFSFSRSVSSPVIRLELPMGTKIGNAGIDISNALARVCKGSKNKGDKILCMIEKAE
ncbi:hypothetical protein RBU55_18305 [Pseudomonas chlororaphis subsp. aurantiaca]|uniref:hypothetical protein n=1 Tax=Pseudomonas chlororaphis TaxID=587753 RepID=UPI0027DEA3C2|nr:hypothetical protein [Pseudomonas chlororaphis]WMI97524.1 hypothetical protein RBU55_18305 [Pseudomonas chlororaphis subsp. aurantiaca]